MFANAPVSETVMKVEHAIGSRLSSLKSQSYYLKSCHNVVVLIIIDNKKICNFVYDCDFIQVKMCGDGEKEQYALV